jgi:hypothetical protein
VNEKIACMKELTVFLTHEKPATIHSKKIFLPVSYKNVTITIYRHIVRCVSLYGYGIRELGAEKDIWPRKEEDFRRLKKKNLHSEGSIMY